VETSSSGHAPIYLWILPLPPRGSGIMMPTSSLLLKINDHTTVWLKGYRSATAGAWGAFVGETCLHEREQFAFTQDSTSLAYQIQEWKYSCTYCHQWKWVLASKERPFDDRCFLSREPHSWQCRYVPSLSVADSTNTKYLGKCICKTNCRIRKVSEKRERKYFSFLFFRTSNVTLPTTQR